MKKLTAVFAAILIACFSISAVFAAGINSSEASVLRNMRTPANMKGNNVYVPSSYINQAESYFNTIEMTSAQAGKINSIINQARTFLRNTGKSSVKELSAAERKTLMNYASSAAAVLNLSAAAGSDQKNIKIISGNGSVVVDDSTSVIKKTGAEESYIPFITVSGLAVLFTAGAAAVIISGRKALSYEKAK